MDENRKARLEHIANLITATWDEIDRNPSALLGDITRLRDLYWIRDKILQEDAAENQQANRSLQQGRPTQEFGQLLGHQANAPSEFDVK